MDSYRQKNQVRQRSRYSLERRMDKWLETGRQVVDGVAGTRPGQRRSDKSGYGYNSGIHNVGKWVEEKLDWFFEEDDDWLEPWQKDQGLPVNSQSKKPLRAISLRGRKSITAASQELNSVNSSNDGWPDESSFRVDRWTRDSKEGLVNTDSFDDVHTFSEDIQRRPLPRSSRRRN